MPLDSPMSVCRVINLELLLKFGPKAWRVQNASLGAANARFASSGISTTSCCTLTLSTMQCPALINSCRPARAVGRCGSALRLYSNAVQAFK